MCPTSNGLKLLAIYKCVFKVSAFRLDIRAQTGAPQSDCRINNTLVKFTVTSRWERRYMVNAAHMVDNNTGSTSRTFISCLDLEMFLQINRTLTKFCPSKLRVPVIITHRVRATKFSSFCDITFNEL